MNQKPCRHCGRVFDTPVKACLVCGEKDFIGAISEEPEIEPSRCFRLTEEHLRPEMRGLPFPQIQAHHTTLSSDELWMAEYIDISLDGKTKVLKNRYGKAGEVRAHDKAI